MRSEDKHMQKAREIAAAVCIHASDTDRIDIIATALHSAQMEERERENERCATIIEDHAKVLDLIGNADGKVLASLLKAEATAIRTTKAD